MRSAVDAPDVLCAAQTIDYLFYTPRQLTPLSVLGMYHWSKALFPAVPQLPNSVLPSDHLPLLTKLAFNDAVEDLTSQPSPWHEPPRK